MKKFFIEVLPTTLIGVIFSFGAMVLIFGVYKAIEERAKERANTVSTSISWSNSLFYDNYEGRRDDVVQIVTVCRKYRCFNIGPSNAVNYTNKWQPPVENICTSCDEKVEAYR